MANVIDSLFVASADSAGRRCSDLRQRITTDRWLAVLLIGIELYILADLSGARMFPLVMGCAAVWGLVTRVRIRVESMALSLIHAMLLIGFLLHYMSTPFPLPVDSQFIQSSFAHSLARLLITVQIIQLYLFQEQGRVPYWIGGCGAVALVFATDISIPESAHHQLLGIIAAFVALFAMYGNRSRKLLESSPVVGWVRIILLSGALVAGLVLGTTAAWGMRKYERSVEWFLSEHLGYGGRSTRAGFSPSGQLQSVTQWKTDGGERVMLRIFADSAPGYLRGKAFDTYRGSSRATSYTPWETSGTRRSLPTTDTSRSGPRVRPGDRIYQLGPSQPVNQRVLDIWPEDGTTATLFTPLGASQIAINAFDVRVDHHDIVAFNDRESAIPYIVSAPQTNETPRAAAAWSPSAEYRQRLTSLNVPVDDEVRQLASRLFADCRTTDQKLDAVRRYFHENYSYNLGINVPRRIDPVTYFLTKQPAAHCEYFATGTAVLLRLAGVPCRYVVGYVCQEWNQVGRFWVARNKDAHAWVEAYDDSTGKWTIVESTPAVGIPQPHQANLALQITDSLRHRLSILHIRIREYGMMETLLSLLMMVWTIPGLILLFGLLALLLAHVRPRGLSLRTRERAAPQLRGMHAALALLEHRTRKQGLARPPEETLTHFAGRLRESATDPTFGSAAADCYVLYVKLRYQGQTGPEAVKRLRQAIGMLPSGTR